MKSKRIHKRRRLTGGDFYNGVEWLACWLLDNAEGETITEEQLRPWAAKAWGEHLKRSSAELRCMELLTDLAAELDRRADNASDADHQSGEYGNLRHDSEIMRSAKRVIEREKQKPPFACPSCRDINWYRVWKGWRCMRCGHIEE